MASGQPIVDAAGQKLGAVVAMHDVTERKELEGLLLQSQRMDAIGQLAGGVAHDFNNLLNVILGYSELALAELVPEHPARVRIEQVRKAGERAAGLTRQLLAFSRKQAIEPRVLDLNALLVDMENMLQRLIVGNIDLVTQRATELGRIRADPGQIEQVVMNLAVNARDAMPDGGKLTIETANVDLDDAFIHRHGGARAGPHVMLAVSDSGMGMAPEIQARIFEPFFTTKERGKGTGLGLAMVYGIVKRSEGCLSIWSRPGRGSVFKVFLPQVTRSDEVALPHEASISADGSETVLLVEEEDSAREMVREALERHGYTVLATGEPGRATAICRGHAGPIELLLTDVVLQRMSGRQLAAGLKELRPELRVLYVSGYADDAGAEEDLHLDGGFLQKPFSLTSLARKVREVLDTAVESNRTGQPVGEGKG
jgi:two-component system, cell cycle sensor histidine kinase and response regulator CckA